MKRFKSMPGREMLRRIFPFLVLLIPLLILLPGWEGFVYSPRAAYSDLVISHYPNAVFLIDSLKNGQFPFWSPTILGGYPFAANPLAGEWYLPGWLALAFPLPLGFNINILLHLFWSGVGMWLFLRALDLDELPALAGALVWELLPKTFAHFGAGHLTLLYAISWTPWLLLAEHRRDRRPLNPVVGVILGLIALADVRWVAYAGVLWLVYSLWHGVERFSPAQEKKSHAEPRSRGEKQVKISLFSAFSAAPREISFNRSAFYNKIVSIISSLLLAALIAAPQLLPLFEYSQLSTRSGMKLEDNFALSLSPLYLFGLIAPNFQGYAEWTVYAGGAALIGLIWALCQPELRRQNGFWLWVLLGALVLSLGSYFPLNSLFARLPGMDLLRVPARFMLIFGFGMAVILAKFLNSDLRSAPAQFWGNLLSFGLMIFNWILVAGIWAIAGGPPWVYLWGAVFVTVSVIAMMVAKRGGIAWPVYQALIVVMVILDLGTASQSNFTYRSPSEVLAERGDVAQAIQSQPGVFRVYSPSYSIPQQTAAAFGLETVSGVDPLQLRSLVDFMQTASGIAASGYSVTLPPLNTPDPTQANQEYVPDAGWLGLLNVRYVVANYPLEAAGLREWRVIGSARIYENGSWRPRAWLQNSQTEASGPWKAVELTHRTPNQIDLKATGPGFVVLSELAYPGWQVWVDDKPAEWIVAHDVLRGLTVGPGDHQIVFRFQPTSVYIGMALGASGWLWVGVFLVVLAKTTKNTPIAR